MRPRSLTEYALFSCYLCNSSNLRANRTVASSRFALIGDFVEAYLLDFDGDLYGQRLRVGFAHRLRDTLAFDTVEQLVAQMERDAVRTRDLLSRA